MTTTDLLTFFQPDESSGTASTFSIQANNGPATEVWVFAREKVNLSRFASATISSDEERRSLLQEISRGLQPGGGILIYARPHNDVVKVQIYCFEGPKYASPKRMLRLSLCGDSSFEDIAGKIDLEIGDHLLFPVSRDAQARLSALYDNLKGLPSDLESSVLNVIRRPSLEWRLDRIERALSMPPATQADQKRSRVHQGSFLERLHAWAMWKVPIGPAVGAALLLTAGALFADRWHRASSIDSQELSAETSASLNKSNKPRIINKIPDKPQDQSKDEPKNLNSSLTALLGALKDSDKSGIKELYAAHFKTRQGDAWKSPDVAWGITKLQALQLGFVNQSDTMLRDRLAQSEAKAAYKGGNFRILEDHQPAADLLAYIWCHQPSNQPEIPATSQDHTTLPLPVNLNCSQLTPDKAVPGLNALTNWVRDTGDQGK